MKKKFIFLFVMLMVLFTGCEDSSISQVKNGMLSFNKKITVGEALDNWDNCLQTYWETFETKNGIKVVNFKCYIDKTGVDDIKKYLERKGWKKELQKPFLLLRSDILTIQFTLNKDDTFQIEGANEEYSWFGDKKYSLNLNSDLINIILESAYNNKRYSYLTYLNDYLNSNRAYLSLYRFYKNAKTVVE
jgi:hypothetical protein